MPADIGGCARHLMPVEVIEVDHGMPAVRFAFLARIYTGLAADTA